jgi:protein involved in polysaccharide export with SLBB domain
MNLIRYQYKKLTFEKKHYMKLKIFTLLIFVAMFSVQQVYSQDISASQLNSVNIDELSDDQISKYWDKAKAEGYSLEQLEVILESRGMSLSKISKLKQRITALRYTDVNTTSTPVTTTQNDISSLEKFGLEGKVPEKEKDNLIFGYDFFTNPNISFTPNINLATPSTYQLGPGDELLIDIWGAAENSYRVSVDREGAVRLENIGPVYVSGLSIEEAKSKIKSYLKRIYSGIGASKNSYNKVHIDISLIGVRTVQVNIIGEIKVPGTYSLSALSSVLNALYAAGGPTENGTFREIQVIRDGQALDEFDIYNYLTKGSEKGNVLLRDQDKIIIKPYLSRINVEGKVKRPGFYELKRGETLENLINYFSGFTSDAYKERLLVERVNGAQKEVSEVLVTDKASFILNDGDKITIEEVIDRYENRITIEGAVYRPGAYELTEGLSLLDVINKADGLKDIAFLERGIIYRYVDDDNKEIIPFSLNNILNKTTTIELKREDKIRIFSKNSLQEKKTVLIDGAIKKPQSVEFFEKMTIEDLIAISGGFREGANVNVIEISRRIDDEDFSTISKTISRTSSDQLLFDGNENFYLEPYDRVSIRYKKGFSIQKSIYIGGEVSYPGIYNISDKDYRISDLVDRSGGFSPYAYIEGASLLRKLNTSEDIRTRELLLDLVSKDSLTSIDVDASEFKIGIDLKKIMSSEGRHSKFDLILQQGDVLTIPSEKQTIQVRGEVMMPSLISYNKSISLKGYINKSGGFTEKAKRKKVYVLYANGDVKSANNFLFFKSYPKLKPGALIIVPTKSERNKASIQEILGITTGLATLGILVNTLVK